MPYKGYKNWAKDTIKVKRNKSYEPKIEKWLKTAKLPQQYQLVYKFNNWFFVHGKKLLATMPPPSMQELYGFEFKEFIKHCKKLRTVLKSYSINKKRKQRSIDKELMFFTAYHYAKEKRDEEFQKNPNDHYDDEHLYNELMYELETRGKITTSSRYDNDDDEFDEYAGDCETLLTEDDFE